MNPISQNTKVYGVSAEDLSTLETLYAAFGGHPHLLDQSVTADWCDIPLNPGQQPGREGAKPLIAGFNAAFSDLKITMLDVIGAADRIAVRAVITGRHTGEWFGIAPTGKEFAIPIHEFHRIENGRLTHTWHLEDWLGWFSQIGAWPVGMEGDRP